MKKYISQKWQTIKKSKTFLFILGVIIGISYTYTYLVGYPYYIWMNEGYHISTEFIRTAEAQVLRPRDGSSVTAGGLSTEGDVQPVGSEARKSHPDIKALVEQYFGEESGIALAIMMAESHGEPDRIGDKHLVYADGRYGMSCGLFQIRILQGRPTCDELLDAERNVAFAYKLYKKSGWQPWSAWTSGAYQKFL